MSDLRVNIRFLMWHFQISNNWRFKITFNDYHKGLNYGWFKVYQFEIFK